MCGETQDKYAFQKLQDISGPPRSAIKLTSIGLFVVTAGEFGVQRPTQEILVS